MTFTSIYWTRGVSGKTVPVVEMQMPVTYMRGFNYGQNISLSDAVDKKSSALRKRPFQKEAQYTGLVDS